MPIGEFIHPESGTETVKSIIMVSTLVADNNWIPVAAPGQQTTLSLKSGDVTLSISEEALKNHLDSWKNGYISVNHVDNGAISGFTIEDAKYENNLLYFKVDSKVAEFIRNIASSGRSIEVQPLKIVNNEVLEFNGLGLSVLYPPHKPACTHDMGCSSHSSSNQGGDTMHKKDTARKKLERATENFKSFMKSMIEESTGDDGIKAAHSENPNTEENMTEDIEKLTSARVLAEKSRDEALTEVETLKSSLSEMDKTIKEKDDLLKSYLAKEAEAATKLKEDQWETLKSSIPPGKIHKQEDHDALKAEFIADPAAFAVKLVSFKKEDPKGESGAQFPPGSPEAGEAADLAAMSELNRKAGRIE